MEPMAVWLSRPLSPSPRRLQELAALADLSVKLPALSLYVLPEAFARPDPLEVEADSRLCPGSGCDSSITSDREITENFLFLSFCALEAGHDFFEIDDAMHGAWLGGIS